MKAKLEKAEQNPQKENTNQFNRRSFLKAGTIFGAAMFAPSVLGNVLTEETKIQKQENSNQTVKTKHRVLGSGNAAFEVSALGLGVMGMNCHRGPVPDRKAMIDLLHKAVDMGVTLFDTAEVYGPYINEELAGEGLGTFKNKSEVSAETIRKAHAVQPVTAIQSEYSLMWREPEEKIFPTLRELKIGFVPYSSLGRGYLTGVLNEQTKFLASNDNRVGFPRFEPAALKANRHLVDALIEFGHFRGMTPAQVALGWLLAKEEWIVPIPGTTKLAHLQENMASANFAISREEWKSLEDTVSKIKIVGNRYPAEQQRQVGR